MADNATIHMYDAGVILSFTIKNELGLPVNLNTVQSVTLYMQKPDRSVVSRLCQVIDETQGIVKYISTVNDFDQSGRWKMQLVIRFADDNIKHSSVMNITISSNISSL